MVPLGRHRIFRRPDDELGACIDRLLSALARRRDPALNVACLEAFDDATLRLDPAESLPAGLRQAIRQMLDRTGAGGRIDRPVEPGLLLEQQLKIAGKCVYSEPEAFESASPSGAVWGCKVRESARPQPAAKAAIVRRRRLAWGSSADIIR